MAGAGSADQPVPLLVAREISERVAADPAYAERFVAAQGAHARRFYRRTGDPGLSLLLGEGVAAHAGAHGVTGSATLGLLHLFLAELALAVTARRGDLPRVEHHLAAARTQFEATRVSAVAARGLVNWHWLAAVAAKARGRSDQYEELLREGAGDPWLRRHAAPPDFVPVYRQQVMLSQDLSRHLLLLEGASAYRAARPLDYYRSVKRVVEFLTNKGMVASASALEPALVSAFAAVAAESTLLSRVSLVKNLAHVRALRGRTAEAAALTGAALREARAAGLTGQVRQLRALEAAMAESDVRGALMVFRV